MKKDFSPILKIKRENIKLIEQKLQEIKNRQQKIEKEKSSLIKELLSQEIPKTEKGGVLSILKRNFSNISYIIKEKENILKSIKMELENIQEEYKKALIDYEKIKYIQNIFEKEHKKEIEKKEQKELDEIASILYLRTGR